MPVLPIDLDEGRRPDLAIEMPDPADERLRNEGDARGQGLESEFRFPTRGGASVDLVAPGLNPQQRAGEDPAQVVEDNPDAVFLGAVQRGIQTHDCGDPVVVVQNVHQGLVHAGTPHAVAPSVDRVVAPRHATPHTVEHIQPCAHVRRAPQPARGAGDADVEPAGGWGPDPVGLQAAQSGQPASDPERLDGRRRRQRNRVPALAHPHDRSPVDLAAEVPIAPASGAECGALDEESVVEDVPGE